MAAVYTIIGVAVIFVALALLLFTGRGAFLIAGYNTATPAERARYDKLRLCRLTGALLLFVAALLLVLAYFGWRVESGLMNEAAMGVVALVLSALVLGAVGVYLHYAALCRK